MKRGVLHISYDLRERPGVAITTAVKELIEESRHAARPTVLDLLRVPRLARENTLKVSDSYVRMDVFGLPYGLLLRHTLRRTAESVCRLCRSGKIDLEAVDVVHCHKASFEGFIGYVVAKEFDKQLIVTLRQSDYDVVRYRPDLRPLVRRILRHSSVIFYATPSMVEFFRRLFGAAYFELFMRPKLVFLPNIVERKVQDGVAGTRTATDHPAALLTVLRMANRRYVRKKNLKRLLKAFARMPEGARLQVIGGGNYLAAVERWIRRRRLDSRVQLLGPVENDAIDRHMQQATAFVLPSHGESFGMAYAEALINGTPIMYSKKTGFDGMFADVGTAVNPRSTRSVHAGLMDVVANNAKYRREIQNLKRANAFAVFSRAQVRAVYARTLERLQDSGCGSFEPLRGAALRGSTS